MTMKAEFGYESDNTSALARGNQGEDYVELAGRKMDAVIEASELLTSVKDSNPKDAVGIRKVPMSCVSMPVVMEMANAMLEGARKYGRHNYRVIGVRSSVYFDAAMRHLSAWWEGEDVDPDSGISHLTKAMATLHVLRDAMVRGKMVDDRPPGTQSFVSQLNKVANSICEQYPTPKEPFVSQGVSDPYVP